MNLFQSKLTTSIYGFLSDVGFVGAKRNNRHFKEQQSETRDKEDNKFQESIIDRRVCCADRCVITGELTFEMGQVGLPCSSQAVIEED